MDFFNLYSLLNNPKRRKLEKSFALLSIFSLCSATLSGGEHFAYINYSISYNFSTSKSFRLTVGIPIQNDPPLTETYECVEVNSDQSDISNFYLVTD